MTKYFQPIKVGIRGTGSFLLGLALAVSFLVAANVRADLIDINDKKPWDNFNLCELFNAYFSEELGGPSGFYGSSNELFEKRGADPYTTWTTSESQLVGAFKVADMGHTMSMYDSSGNLIGQIMNVGGTDNIGEFDGITDLSGISIVDIPPGLNVNFRLDAEMWGDIKYSWSSNPDENDGSLGKPGDGMVHMIALDITDLYNLKHGALYDSVFMFGWEDLHLTAANGGLPADWDYQDFVVIMTNVKPYTPEMPPVVPEPATLALMGLGLIGVGLVARRRMKR